MNQEISITGSVQMTKKSKYLQAILNIPLGEGNKTKPKWISTQETDKVKAYKKFIKLIDEYEEVMNDPNKTPEEKIELIFPTKRNPIPNEHTDESEPMVDTLPNIFNQKPGQIRFIDVLKNWRHAFDDIEVSTVDGYENNFESHIIPYFEGKGLMLKEVKRRDIQQFVNDLGEHGRKDGKGGMSKESVKKYVSNIRKVLDMAVDEEWIPENPAYNIKYTIKYYQKVETEPLHLDLDQLLTLLNYLLTPDKLKGAISDNIWGYAAGIIFASFYALRRSEIYGLRWQDIDWDNDIVSIENAMVRTKTIHEKRPKSKASRAPMPLIPFVKTFLIQLKAYQEKCAEFYGNRFGHSDYICCRNADGSRFGIDYLNYRLQKDLALLGIEPIISQHELRHSTATLLRSLGFSEQEIQSWLRHADLDTTMHYAHDNIKVKLRAGEVLNNILGQNDTFERIAV